ncbi:pyridoxal-phosphate dependent enzyme [Archangium minus]|uniref:Pyridoxal-phosphate dependent enzyme n=1 Tax=Archangium minus TaxID=83450 RepID=A0ABY9WPN4_9BACT|nr:pyridoxal-phosphate dependent enzyme [Archangium violaceum]WNG45760.1 pyridoxal-phosphate dependent enzyme [Archangium minus]
MDATPLVPLDGLDSGLFGKVEFRHPSGSMKHRSIPAFLEERMASGVLRPSQPLIVHSAGAAAVTTAWAGARMGCPVHAIIPRNSATGVVELLRWLGAEPHAVASREAPAFIAELQRTHDAWFLDQFGEPALIDHYRVVSSELVSQLPDIEAVVVGMGTGVSITGIGREMRRLRPSCRVIGVEPAECQLSTGAPWAPHRISGLAPPMPKPLLDSSVIDEVIAVSSDEAWAQARTLARRDGLLAGPSAGATLAAALRLREQHGLRRIVAILGGSISELLGSH